MTNGTGSRDKGKATLTMGATATGSTVERQRQKGDYLNPSSLDSPNRAVSLLGILSQEQMKSQKISCASQHRNYTWKQIKLLLILVS